MITTTLNAIRSHSPCEDGWQKLLKHLGKIKADNEPLKFSTILESNGLDDALWCLRSLDEEHHLKIRHLAADFAERVLHLYEAKYPNDDRPRKAIQAVRDFADGKIKEQELKEAAGRAATATATATAADWAAAWAAGRAADWAAADADAWAAGRAAAAAAAWATATATATAADWAAANAAAERQIQAELLIKYFG